MESEVREVLEGVYKLLRKQQEAIGQMQILGTSLLQALRESNPAFESRYAKAREALSESSVVEGHADILRLIDEILQKLRRV
jgi:hypothetical protein